MIKKLSAMSFVAMATFFVLGLQGWAVSSCDNLAQELQQYSVEQKAFQQRILEKTQLHSENLKALHDQLQIIEGKAADDLSWALGAASGLNSSIAKISEALFERADLANLQAEQWLTSVGSCYGNDATLRLQEWGELHYEVLTTMASFYSLYSQEIESWMGEWRGLEKNKSFIPIEQFLAVDKAEKDFLEAIKLNTALFENTQEAFVKINPTE